MAVIGQGINNGGGRLGLLTITFFSLCVTVLVARSLSEKLLLGLTQDMVLHLRLSLSRRLVETPLRKLQEIGKAELLVLLTQDVDSLTRAAQLLPTASGSAIVVVACFGYLAWISPMLCVLLTLCLTTGIIAFQLAERRPIRQFMKVREHTDALYAHFRALVEGSKELQLNAARAGMFVETVIGSAARQFRAALIAAMGSYIWVDNIGGILFFLAIGLTEFVLPFWLPLTIEMRVSSTLVLLYLVQPVTALMLALPSLRQAIIALHRLQQLNDTLQSVPHPVVSPDPFGSLASRITLHGLCHQSGGSSDGEGFHLGPLDLSFGPGEIVFVVGGNGSGKTTLTLLLAGLFEPTRGWIELNGIRITPANLAQYRARFSAVFYDFHLFEHLIGPDTSRLGEQARDYVELLGLAHKVQVTNNRFSTTALSSGQRRRLALVSAYIEDRLIYLFDEWAADQDPVFRHIFYTKLLPDLKEKGKMVIVITHDDRYFGCADKVFHLDRGRLQTQAHE